MVATNFSVWLALACSASAAVIERQTTCSSYTIINTRGTGEQQGPSSGFRTMNANVQRAVPGGKIYNTVYPASFNQQSSAGTRDIVNKVQTTLRSNPNECFILEGYSQGATVDALPMLTGASITAVKGVFLIGDPDHKAGLTCNVDNNGGTTTRNVNGLSARGSAGIPANWVAKTLDVCILGDGVCDTTNGRGINRQHLQYPNDAPTQNLGTQFITARLRGTS
ncbi:Putative cutinase/acetylxylan esterase, alpha/Beta hydrolase [Septoria linicola]|uniref:Cutinase/acetylxylan esterase, alpha/Beta hydrolase n=1 Tax=Septoria linicola TaxID=215465 RepID=A0A9Q9EMJ0_9PEZI|nr:Putative cutinase/acetylxylan esterase, alpha/Beta hydrolase [Septoria linicola]